MARRLANWLRAYSEYTSNSEAPDAFNFWTGVSTIAGALRRQVWIDEIKFKWYPNFYIIFVAPPGIATKSTTTNVGMRLLRQVDGVVMGPSSMTWQGLTFGLQNSLQMIPQSFDPVTGMGSDYVGMSAVTCDVGELGTFLNPKDTELTSVLIDLWDGKDVPWERWLKTAESTKIENPWINVLSATTPSWLRDNFTDIMIGGGLASRVIFVFADKKSKIVPYISRVTNKILYDDLEEALIHDLKEIAILKGTYKLTDEAYAFGEAWDVKHWTEPEEHLKGERFGGYRARKQTHIHKIAMVLAAAESDELIITKKHLELAVMFISGVEHDMHKVFESIGTSLSSKHANEILSFLRIYKKVGRKDLWRHCMRYMAPKEFGEAVDSCCAAGYIIITNGETEPIYWYTKEETPPKPNGSLLQE